MAKNKTSYTSNSSNVLSIMKRMLMFSFVLLLLCFVFFALNQYLFNNYPFKVDKDITTIVTGNSHIRGGFVEEIIPASKNIAQSAEPTSISYFKLRHVLQNNPQIKNVILGFSYNNYSTWSNQFFKNDWGKEMENRIYPLVDFKDFKRLNLDRRSFFNQYLKKALVPNVEYLSNLFTERKSFSFIGSYTPEEEEKLKRRIKKKIVLADLPNTNLNQKKLKENVARQFGMKKRLSKENKHYLDQIILLCQELDVQLIILSMPMHHDYLELIPKNIRVGYEKLEAHCNTLDNVQFINFSDNVKSDRLFRNHDHLNGYGALVFSRRFRRFLKENKII